MTDPVQYWFKPRYCPACGECVPWRIQPGPRPIYCNSTCRKRAQRERERIAGEPSPQAADDMIVADHFAGRMQDRAGIGPFCSYRAVTGGHKKADARPASS